MPEAQDAATVALQNNNTQIAEGEEIADWNSCPVEAFIPHSKVNESHW